ncbi:MAG: hypothetical protein A2157_14210 [Deltaproteobacteria bacterium RBG_16_47_11]|nr:MAG: hypothetical protein A2157_14210 [Deltaproteobacteria bacterium RBG_16_47_11]
MISPFLFSEEVFLKANRRPLSRYAGRREDGACFRLKFICAPEGGEKSLTTLFVSSPNGGGKD